MGLKDYSCLTAVGSSGAVLPIGHSHEPLLFKGTVGGNSRLSPPAGPYSAQTARQQTSLRACFGDINIYAVEIQCF